MKTRVDLFFDVISPYSWLSFEALSRYKTVWNIDLKLRPYFLSGIMSLAENRPPMMVPAKGAYMQKDLHRMRYYWSVPLNAPKDPVETMLNKGSLQAQRYLVSLKRKCPEKLEDGARELFMRIWSRDEDITSKDSLLQVSDKIGLPRGVAENVVGQLGSAEVKEELKKETQEAFEAGAFGAPWIMVHAKDQVHSIWGADRFHIIADILGEKFPGPMRELAKVQVTKAKM